MNFNVADCMITSTHFVLVSYTVRIFRNVLLIQFYADRTIAYHISNRGFLSIILVLSSVTIYKNVSIDIFKCCYYIYSHEIV